MSECPYEPAPVSPSDWRDYVRSNPYLHPQPPESNTRAYQYTSLDPRALIDERDALASFHHRRSRAGQPIPAHDTAALVTSYRQIERLKNRPLSHTLTVETLGEASNNRERLSRVRRIDRCGIDDVVFRNETGYEVYPTHCRCRACPRCDKARRRRMQRQFDERIKLMKRPKFITLTLKQSDEELAVSVHRIKEAFRRMRSCIVWKSQVRGGFWVLEIKRNTESCGWNVHLHAIIDSAYLPQDWLSRTWLRYTGDSYIVDIRKATPSKTRYMTKYVTKGSDVSAEGELLWLYYESLHRMRDVSTFGNQFGFSAEAASETSGLLYCGVVSDILTKARNGDIDCQLLASEIMDALAIAELEPPDAYDTFLNECVEATSQN